jgi:hypothetical protein
MKVAPTPKFVKTFDISHVYTDRVTDEFCVGCKYSFACKTSNHEDLYYMGKIKRIKGERNIFKVVVYAPKCVGLSRFENSVVSNDSFPRLICGLSTYDVRRMSGITLRYPYKGKCGMLTFTVEVN